MYSKIKDWIPQKYREKIRIYKKKRVILCDSKKTQEYALKQKGTAGKKIKIAFVVYMPEVWNSLKMVHDIASQDDQIETLIVAQPWISVLGKKQKPCRNDAFEFFRKQYDDVVNAYEETEDTWFDLKAFEPTYVFYTRPYTEEYYPDYRPEVVRTYARVCWIPYGYTVLGKELFESIYSMEFLRFTTNIFVDSQSAENWVRTNYGDVLKSNLICLGYPRFDLCVNLEKEESKKKTILWTPRWTSETKGVMKSNFLNYYKQMFDFAEKNPDYEIIFRPHPLMFANYIEHGIMTKEEVDKLQDTCKRLGNIQFDKEKDYLVSISKADLIVTDFSTLLAEYFASGKRILYCDRGDLFVEDGKKMDSHFEHAESWEEIEQCIFHMEQVAPVSQEDIFDVLSANVGHVGQDIVDYLKCNV